MDKKKQFQSWIWIYSRTASQDIDEVYHLFEYFFVNAAIELDKVRNSMQKDSKQFVRSRSVA
jgi:5-methylcytosine-specific restriction endonuclease McrBC GTP-binding regulatory subunit McrB